MLGEKLDVFAEAVMDVDEAEGGTDCGSELVKMFS